MVNKQANMIAVIKELKRSLCAENICNLLYTIPKPAQVLLKFSLLQSPTLRDSYAVGCLQRTHSGFFQDDDLQDPVTISNVFILSLVTLFCLLFLLSFCCLGNLFSSHMLITYYCMSALIHPNSAYCTRCWAFSIEAA